MSHISYIAFICLAFSYVTQGRYSVKAVKLNWSFFFFFFIANGGFSYIVDY